jgi:hypothetical protein
LALALGYWNIRVSHPFVLGLLNVGVEFLFFRWRFRSHGEVLGVDAVVELGWLISRDLVSVCLGHVRSSRRPCRRPGKRRRNILGLRRSHPTKRAAHTSNVASGDTQSRGGETNRVVAYPLRLRLDCISSSGTVGETVKVEFAIAPLPFDLLLEQSDERTVAWRTQTFPPDVESREGGSTMSFRHAGFGDEDEAGRVAHAWGQIMVRLKEYADTGTANPVFA